MSTEMRERIERIISHSSCASSELYSLQLFNEVAALRGKRVLEIGGAAPINAVSKLEVAGWCSVDPANVVTQQGNGWYQVIRGFCSNLPFEDASFDSVFSANAFEHIIDLNDSLREIGRVLRPGGILFSHFGPIWSGPDGHHLEIRIGDRDYSFWKNPVIPPWLHLLVDEMGMLEILKTSIPENDAAVIAEYIFRSPFQNRYSYEDFEEMIERADFLEKIAIKRICELDYAYNTPVFNHPFYLENYQRKVIEMSIKHLLPSRELHCRDLLMVIQRR